jgi:hypothetical protein
MEYWSVVKNPLLFKHYSPAPVLQYAPVNKKRKVENYETRIDRHADLQ